MTTSASTEIHISILLLMRKKAKKTLDIDSGFLWTILTSIASVRGHPHRTREFPHQWRIQDIPKVGAATLPGGANIRFCHISPKAAWNWRNLDPQEGARLSCPLLRAATAHFPTKFNTGRLLACYVMLWPALTWRGQEWAQHVQGQFLHTCITQMAGSHHVMELPLTVYKCRASLVKLLLSITFVLRAVLCAVRIKLQKEIIFLRVLLYCMTKSYPLEQFPHP